MSNAYVTGLARISFSLFCLSPSVSCTDPPASTENAEPTSSVTEAIVVATEWRPDYAAPDHKVYATTPAEQTALQQVIDQKDLSAIRKHGWNLWSAITAMTDQDYSPGDDACGMTNKLATYDTWWGQEEIFRTPILCPDGKPCPPESMPQRYWHTPRQAGGAQVLSFNKYSKEFLDWVNTNTLYVPATFEAMNKKLDASGAPLADRIVTTFIPPPQATATMLKPTYWVLKRDTPMMMPFWKGPLYPSSPDNSATPRHPVVSTWENFVLYDPTGIVDPTAPREVTIYGEDGPETKMVVPQKVVTPDDFYALSLTAADIAFIKGANIFTIGGITVDDLEPCDVAVLVGMHVTTAEVKNWTWQTFYWNPFPADNDQPGVTGPFRHFDMATAYYFDGADGEPHIAFNPYLEPPITGPTFMNPMTMYGARSNCMSCHHAAAFPTLNKSSNPGFMLQGSYFADGPVTGEEQWFRGRVKTLFMWGMLISNQSKTGQSDDDVTPDQQ